MLMSLQSKVSRVCSNSVEGDFNSELPVTVLKQNVARFF